MPALNALARLLKGLATALAAPIVLPMVFKPD